MTAIQPNVSEPVSDELKLVQAAKGGDDSRDCAIDRARVRDITDEGHSPTTEFISLGFRSVSVDIEDCDLRPL